MGDVRHALRVFAKAYVVAIVLLGILAIGIARLASRDVVSLYQLILALMGVAYVFASVLAWTGFASLYRFSPTLFVGLPSYRRSVVRPEIMKEGRNAEALATGALFGLSLVGSAIALLGWLYAALVIAVAVGVVLYVRRLEPAVAKPSG
jgi:hypothetical protein